jgi:hypothetical protein
MGTIDIDRLKEFRFDDIRDIVKRCEAIQDDMNISESTKRNEKLYAYEDIRDIISNFFTEGVRA